jgi:hypothetical protein
MQLFTDNIQDQYGNAVSGASVLISLNGSPATIYSDNGSTPKANPLTTNTKGEFSFYAANGTYIPTVTISGGSPVVSPSVTLFDPDEMLFDASTPYAAGTVGAKLSQTISVKDEPYGAVGDGVTDDTAAVQAALDAGGPGSRVLVPRGFYKIAGTLTRHPGQIIEGEGWETTVGTYALAGGSVLVQTSVSDIPLIEIAGASDAAQEERGGLRDIALKYKTDGAVVGTGYKATNSRQNVLENVYVASFNIGIEQGNNCWQWGMRNVRVMDAAKCLYSHDSGEDSTYLSCIFRSYRASGLNVHMKNMSQTNLFLGCDISNADGGVWMEQGDANGDGTGTPYPMHASFLNCQFEELATYAIKTTSSNGSAAAKYHPQVIAIGCRGYNFNTPSVGQIFIDAQHASYVELRALQSTGYSYGVSIGASVGQVVCRPGPGAVFGTAVASGQIDRIYDVPHCKLQSAALSYSATDFTVIPYTTIVSDAASMYVATARIKPQAGTHRVHVSLASDSAPAGRYVLILKKNDAGDLGIVDFYVSTGSQPLLLQGAASIEANGSDEFTVTLYSPTASFTVNTASSFFSIESAVG